MAGFVALVGAGPGDPDLLTLRALRLIRHAEVIVYDTLVGPAIAAALPQTAERIACPAGAGRQDDIHRLLAARALAGRSVVRLKGGDPTVFGRLGEEIDYLRARGIPFEVVPGVTAATAAAAAAGLPLTRRNVAEGVALVSGQRADGALPRWLRDLGPRGMTLAIYMGAARLPQLAAALQGEGWAACLPAVVVERASLPEQRIRVGRLGNLDAEAVRAPALTLVGEALAS
jgi:uroporphyrin-III C-methyltransferase/precorrin-2 dehydrogenase/sirohydrochlorin ferrochelatase